MTRTENRLTDALECAAATVRVDTLRPLTAPGQGRRVPRWRSGAQRGHRRRTGLVALAAAASVAAVVAASAALINQAPSPGPTAAGTYIGGSEPAVPAFFVNDGSTGPDDQRLRVVSLASGAVTATEPAPAGTNDITFLAEQAQTGNFVAAFNSNHFGGQVLYRFSITATGKITPLTRIAGITLKQGAGKLTVLALSPDGSRLALSWTSNTIPAPGAAVGNKIMLLNLRTGAQQTWQDRLTDGTYYPEVTSAVWTPDGRALTFASDMCELNSQTNPCFWEFRSLRVPPAGDALQAGPVLLRQHGMSSEIRAPAISPDGSSVVEVRDGASQAGEITLVRIGLSTGTHVVLHQWRGPGTYQVGANEGNFLIVARQLHNVNNWVLLGWVDGRGFHSGHFSPSS